MGPGVQVALVARFSAQAGLVEATTGRTEAASAGSSMRVPLGREVPLLPRAATMTVPDCAAARVTASNWDFQPAPSPVERSMRVPRESEMMSAWLATASSMPWRTQLRRPLPWPASQAAVGVAPVPGRRSRTLMFSSEACGATPMTLPVEGPSAPVAREAVQVPWPVWSCGVPSSQALGRPVMGDWSISERLKTRLGEMSGWEWSMPVSRTAMRTPAPLLMFQGPVGAAPGMLSPKPPACWTARPGVEDHGDAGLGGEIGLGCCVIEGDGGHAEAVQMRGEVSSGEGDLAFGVCGDDAGAVDDYVVIGGDGFCDLRVGGGCRGE